LAARRVEVRVERQDYSHVSSHIMCSNDFSQRSKHPRQCHLDQPYFTEQQVEWLTFLAEDNSGFTNRALKLWE